MVGIASQAVAVDDGEACLAKLGDTPIALVPA
jgi:hypothetical protein